MIKGTVRIVVELEHAQQRFQRNAKFVTKVYFNGKPISSHSGDIASELKNGFAMDISHKCTITRPFKGRFTYKNGA